MKIYSDEHITYKIDNYYNVEYSIHSTNFVKIKIPKDYKKINSETKVLIININKKLENIDDFQIKHIIFYQKYNHELDYLPHSVQCVLFGKNYNKEISLDHKTNLTHLFFGIHFNQKVDNLPITIQSIIFGIYFNKPIDFLPSNLKFLILGYYYNQPTDNLPNNVVEIIFGHNFNKSICNLPLKLERITFNCCFNKSVAHLPQNIKKIYFVEYFELNRLSHFTFDFNDCYLPYLEYIKLPSHYNKFYFKKKYANVFIE